METMQITTLAGDMQLTFNGDGTGSVVIDRPTFLTPTYSWERFLDVRATLSLDQNSKLEVGSVEVYHEKSHGRALASQKAHRQAEARLRRCFEIMQEAVAIHGDTDVRPDIVARLAA